MHADDTAQLQPTRRPSTAHDRPARAPFGPRRPKGAPDTPPDPALDALLASPDSSFDPLPHTQLSISSFYADAAVQVPSTPLPSNPSLPSSPTRPPAGTFVAPPPLTPPPAISFESTPIPWKGLPLEAAQWTFSSSELQEIVSRAIRLSARDSFVRLLSLQALEVDIVRESERLDAARLEAQAKWRFELGRRTMLMQALNASAAFFTPSPGPGSEHAEGGTNPILGFVGQLASAIASCDSLLSTILQISDQQSQITLIQHQHWSSALGMALRKLNKAHERQGQELKRAQARVQTLEDELEEAWHAAEKMAIEFDDLEQEIAESEGSEIVCPEDVLDLRPDLGLKHDIDETGTLGDLTIHTDIAVVLGVTATAVASKATLIPSTTNLVPSTPPVASISPVPTPIDKSDTKSIPSVKSTRSRRSTRDGQTHLAHMTSTRMRSRAASNASLRLPKSLRSTPSTHTSPVDAPPMPALPLASVPGSSFLDMGNVTHEHVRKVPPKRHPEPTLALPTPPHSAGLSPTPVPSIWLESDDDKPRRLTALDRSHSLQIFSSLSPRKMRRSNLVMSLTGSDRSSDGERSRSPGSRASGSSSVENQTIGVSNGTSTGSPTSNHSPVSLPTYALAHFRGPSLSSSSHSTGAVIGASASAGRVGGDVCVNGETRPGSAGARLTMTGEEKPRTPSVGSPRKSLVSRASSVILRRLSQATTGAGRVPVAGGGPGVGGGRATAMDGRGILGSPSRSREATRLNGGGRALVDRWKDKSRCDDVPENGNAEGAGAAGAEGEVMLIGSPHADDFDAP